MASTPSIQVREVATPSAGVQRRRLNLVPYLFVLPHLIFFAAFLAWPFFYGLYISLFNWDFTRPGQQPFVGLQNYANLFNPGSLQFDDFWRSMKQTGYFMLWSVPPLVIFSLLLAVLLNGKYRGRNFFRALYFAPYALSVTVASLLWWWIFQVGGLLSTYFDRLGLPAIQWLSSMPWAWISITIATLWWTIGFNTVIFLTALQEIPDSLYEAAAIDGANGAQQFRHITLPSLRPVTTFVITITLLASANLFGQVYLMTAGGPERKTESIIFWIYREGFNNYRQGNAAAMSVVVAAVLALLTVLNFRIFGRGEQA